MKTTDKKINLVIVEGIREFGGVDNTRYEDLISFEVTDISPSDPNFIFHLKNLVQSYAFEFFDMKFGQSEKLLEKAKTLEEIETIAKSIEYDGSYECKWTSRIKIIEIKNKKILKGLKHLEENFFESDYGVNEKIKKLKKNKKFKEALELKESFNELFELVEDSI